MIRLLRKLQTYTQKMQTKHILFLFLGLSLFFNWYYLAGGFYADDLIFLNMRSEEHISYSHWKGLWSTDQIPEFQNLWFKDSDARGVFFRPLPSVLFELSLEIFGENAFPLHLLSLIAHGIVVFLFYKIAYRLTKDRFLSVLSGVFYIACEDHSMVVGWIAATTDIYCVLFLNLSILAHLNWRETRRNIYLFYSIATMALAFLCKESAVIGPVVIVALEFFLYDKNSLEGDFQFTEVGKRFRHLFLAWKNVILQILLLVIYLGVYKFFHLGIMKNLMYLDPFSAPLEYGLRLFFAFPIMLLAAFSPIPPSLASFTPEFQVPMVWGGVTVIILFLFLFFPYRKKAVLWFFAVEAIIILLPQLGADVSERLLYFPFGAFIL